MKPIDFIPIGLAIACYTLAGVFSSNQAVMIALVGLGGTLTGVGLPQLSSRQRADMPAPANVVPLPPRDKQAGHAAPGIVFTLLFTGLAVLLASALLCPRLARADVNDPATGGCAAYNNDAVLNADGSVRTPATCKVSFQLSFLTPMAAVNFKTGDALTGANAVALGPCYGFTWQPGRWYGSGADLCLTIREATGEPNRYTGALMLHTARFGAVGVGAQGTQKANSGGVFWQAVGFLALKVPVL